MKRLSLSTFALIASLAPQAWAEAPTGLNVPIGDPSRANQEYVWISNASNLPLFVERVYPGLESARKAFNVNVRIAGPTSVDLAAFITTVDAECTKNPAGVIVVGGWDDALASEVDKCIDKKVPTVVTDGDLPMSKRLTYLGTNWYNLGYQHGQYQCRYHKEAGLAAGEIGTISFLAASNFIAARQGLRDALAKECPDVKVVADEESGTNVEQVAANTAAIIQGHPNLTGMVGFDSEAGPGIVRAVTESGKSGKIIVTSNEAGRDFMNSIKDGTVKMINMEKYETMDFFAVAYLYTFHNDIIRNLGMDHWLQNPLPAIGDSGLIFVTSENVDTILAATDPAAAAGNTPTGLNVPIGDPSRANQEYVWISNASNLPLFVERVYPGLESARKALNVNVRIAGPTSVDLAAFITTVDAECTKNPAGVIVVGGWDDALASEVDKCIDKKVPTVVTDGDLPMSKRLTYLGTNWYNLGYQHGQYQCRYHKEAGLAAGEIGTISFLAASNFIAARQGLRDALAKECPDVKVVADEESGTNVEQVAANTAAIIQGHPNLTGMVGFDSEAGPGIVRAVTESGKSGKIIVTSNEAGRDFMNSIKDGTVKMINMEKYETMDYFAVLYLYTFKNDIIRSLGMDQWLQNPLPAIGDSGLIFVTSENVDTILAATAPAQ
jgi:ribose transport system substrate-binding protein